MQQNAEALAGIAVTQVVRPGSPVIYGGFTSNVDMRSGSPAFGTPEYAKACLVGGQLAPIYYFARADAERPCGGWFVGPSFELSYDRVENMRHHSLAAEGGYSFVFDGDSALVIAAQLGVSFFSDSRSPALHPGIYPSFGWWL